MPRFAQNTCLIAVIGLALIVLSLVGFRQPGWSAQRGTLVVFDANWCASCRQIEPVIRDIAGQNNLAVVKIDIDQQDAPRQAHNYGLTISNDGPPQVFYVNKGRATLLYNGGSGTGSSEKARALILQNLQRVLPPGA